MVLMMILSLWSVHLFSFFFFFFFFFLPLIISRSSRFLSLYTCCAGVFFDSAYTWPLYIPIYIPPDNVIGTWLLQNGRQHVMSFFIFIFFSFVFHGAGMAGRAVRLG